MSVNLRHGSVRTGHGSVRLCARELRLQVPIGLSRGNLGRDVRQRLSGRLYAAGRTSQHSRLPSRGKSKRTILESVRSRPETGRDTQAKSLSLQLEEPNLFRQTRPKPLDTNL
ncbi:unnamed protein product [Protopolystoma xenopodis]|uniref:Uncharacterized protein n=1 Tax=Protopolystoma xenopodis TaxID=117903 RepID=A0A3S5FE31_9PLAT|nr:unnamed protein product [Protopolystoma xenopodis]